MPRILRFDAFDVTLASGELRKHGIRVHLREQAFQARVLLLERPGEVVSRKALRQRLWPGRPRAARGLRRRRSIRGQGDRLTITAQVIRVGRPDTPAGAREAVLVHRALAFGV